VGTIKPPDNPTKPHTPHGLKMEAYNWWNPHPLPPPPTPRAEGRGGQEKNPGFLLVGWRGRKINTKTR